MSNVENIESDAQSLREISLSTTGSQLVPTSCIKEGNVRVKMDSWSR
jgi:hypothetical protein